METQEATIEREAALCREACKDCKVGDVMSHIHHGEWLEILSEPVENRIKFILKNKPKGEQAERLRRLRPFQLRKAEAEWRKAYAEWRKAYAEREKAYAEWRKADAEWEKAYASPAMLAIHAEVCGCPWTPETDIFGKWR